MASLHQKYKGGNWHIHYREDGKLCSRSTATKDKRRATEILKRFEYENIQRKGARYTPNAKAMDVLSDFLNHKKGNVVQATYEQYRYYVTCYLSHSQVRSIGTVTDQSINHYLNSISDKKYARNHAARCIKTFFNYCTVNNYINENPAKNIKGLKIQQNPPKYLSEKQSKALLEWIPRESIYPIVATAYYSGMRKGEIKRMKDRDIQQGKIMIPESKAKTFRSIPIHPKLKEILDKNPPPFDWVNFRRDWKRIKKSSGIEEDFRFHDLRHNFASQLVIKGVSLYTVSKLLGHSDVRITQIYSHLSPEHLKNSVELL